MADPYDVLLKGGTIVNQNGRLRADLAIRAGRVAAFGALDKAVAAQVIDCTGLHILPGVIDTQVHFREPGGEHKEDLESGSRAAVMGGVTAVFEMPNTSPQTTSKDAMADKVARASNRMHCDFAFFIGGTRENVDLLPELELLPGCCGVKVFMGSSTGDLLVEDDAGIAAVLRKISRRAAFHSEDEAMLLARKHIRVEGDPHSHTLWRNEEVALNCTRRLLDLARAAGKRVHVLHISTAQEMVLLADYRDVASVEVTPQHLTLLADEAYTRLGTFAQMNPPLRNADHQRALWAALNSGLVDVLGSDHAPHTKDEKAQTYPKSPSGMPGVQTLVPIMLNHVNAGRLSLERFVDLTSAGPARLYNIAGKGRIAEGYDADLTIVDLARTETITENWVASKCGWTPFEGMKVTGWPVGTFVRGHKVMWQGELVGPSTGQPVRFQDALKRH